MKGAMIGFQMGQRRQLGRVPASTKKLTEHTHKALLEKQEFGARR